MTTCNPLIYGLIFKHHNIKTMSDFFRKHSGILIIIALILAGCASSKITESNYVGNWHYTFPTMEGGEMKAVMVISREGKEYKGVLTSEMGNVDLQDLQIIDDKLTAYFTIEGNRLDLTGVFSDDTYSGTTSIQGYEFPMNATKEKK